MKTQVSKGRRSTLLPIVPILFACLHLNAQQPDTPTLQPNPIAALRAFEPPADLPYQLGPGDAITVEAIGRAELSGKHIIGPDGKITMPIAGTILLTDLTRDQAARTIEAALSPFYDSISISIGIDRYTSNQILLLGAVQHPGLLTFDKTPTLLAAVSRGGSSDSGGGEGNSGGSSGESSGGSGEGSSGSRSAGIPEEVIIYRGADQMMTVKLRELLDEGNPLANMRLKRNDIVYVTGRTSFVSILGQVYRPGNLHLEKSSTLAELLAQAGGPNDKAGHNPDIRIIHQIGATGATRTQVVPFKTLLQHASYDVTLQTGDIIYVPQSGFSSTSYVFQQLSPLFNLVTVGALLGQ